MDAFIYSKPAVADPARSATAITPNDTTEFEPTKALFVGTGGTVVVRLADMTSNVSFTNVGNGQILPIRAIRVISTGTTASDVLGLY